MSLLTAEFPPGLSRRGTIYQNKGRWYNSSCVRWYEGAMKPIGGWVKRITTAFTGKGRAMIIWRGGGVRYFAVGTESKLYAATPSLTAMVDITPVGFTSGYADAATGGGYGVGLYGVGTYGTPRSDSTVLAYPASMWTLDTFGDDLIGIMAEDSNLYQWQLDITTPTKAALVSGSPTGSACVTTPEGFVVVMAAGGDARKLQWCDRRDIVDWTPTSSNQAGDYDIETQGQLMCGRRTRNSTLIWTDLDAYAMTYIGLPFVYDVARVGENSGIISRGAHAAADGRVFWWGPNGFCMWDGASVQPMDCHVYDKTIGNLNFTQRSKVSAMSLAAFGEIWWFYPSSGSTENDMAVVFNYKEGTWTLHTLARLSGADSGIYNYPMMVSSDSFVYEHETGSTWDASPYAESGPYELGEGDNISRIRRIIFDEGTANDVSLYCYTRDWNNDTETTHGPFTAPNPVSVRIAGRAVRMKVVFATAGQWGSPRFDLMTGGRRG